MNKFGVQYIDKSLEGFIRKGDTIGEFTEQHREIIEILKAFQAGYSERNIEKADTFVEELFIAGEDTCVLGTGTGELFLGSEQVKELIKGDWEYRGDVNINWQNPHIHLEGEAAWFLTTGSVKYSFEDTPERYDNYVDFIKNKAEDTELTAKERITFISWVLALTYHQRLEKKREYLWPMGLSGVLLKNGGKWKFAHLQFSISKANFPDERFESSKGYLENYNKQNAMADGYKNNQITEELKGLLKKLESKFFGKEDISTELVSKYFAADSEPYILGPENQWCQGLNQVKEFMATNSASTLSLDLDHAIASKVDDITWIEVTGILRQQLTEDELAEVSLKELDKLFKADITSQEKLFAAHKSVSYVLKESATGENYTCPIRLTAVVLNRSEGPVFQHIHFSFPSYWIFEGKLNSI